MPIYRYRYICGWSVQLRSNQTILCDTYCILKLRRKTDKEFVGTFSAQIISVC